MESLLKRTAAMICALGVLTVITPSSFATSDGQFHENETYVLSSEYEYSPYYANLIQWFEDNNCTDEEIENMLNDEETMKIILSDDFWNTSVSTCAVEETATPRSNSYPIAGYSDGDYFSNNRQACTHHVSDFSTCYLDGSCGCRSFESSIQCAGFARLVYWASTGSSITSQDMVSGLSSSQWTTANIKKYFTDKITIGSYVRLYLRSYGHSFIVTDITDTGISVYDCNYVGPCEVDMRNLTWADIKSKFTYIVNAYCY